VTLLTLNRLARSEGTALISHLAGGRPLPADVLADILAKTEGVPLFVEELTKAVLESGLLKETNERYELTSPMHFLPIPSTLQDSLMARLDRQAPIKEVAQIGAVIGREFSYDLLAAVADLDAIKLAAGLEKLVRAELVLRHGTPPEVSYAFKHVLLQDAAYASILKSKRQELHRRIAEVLETRFPEVAKTEPESLARHFTEAGESDRAIDYWLQAGQRAAERSANLEATAHLKKGLDLLETLSDSPQRARRELALQTTLGMPLIATKGYGAAETGAAYDRAHELCERVGDAMQLLPILYGQLVYRLAWGDLRTAQKLSEAFLRTAEDQGAEGPALVARRMFGVTLSFLGELTASRTYLEQALALYDAKRHLPLTFQYGADHRSASLAWLAKILWLLGYPDQAVRARDDAIAQAHEAAHAITLAHGLRIGGLLVDSMRRDWRSAQKHGAALKAFAEQQRLSLWLAWAKFILGRSLAERESTPAAVAQMREALIEFGLQNYRADRPFFLVMLAEAHGRLGQTEAGLTLIDEALALVEETETRWWEAEVHRVRGNLLALDNVTGFVAAKACFEQAIAVARRQHAKSLELRAATSLACLWADRGERQQALDLLAPLYGWFTEGFDTPDLMDAKSLLDALS
jgi:predicted ATPase